MLSMPISQLAVLLCSTDSRELHSSTKYLLVSFHQSSECTERSHKVLHCVGKEIPWQKSDSCPSEPDTGEWWHSAPNCHASSKTHGQYLCPETQWHDSAIVALYLSARWKHFTVTAHLYRWRSGYARGQRDTAVSVRTQEELFSEHTAVCFTCQRRRNLMTAVGSTKNKFLKLNHALKYLLVNSY